MRKPATPTRPPPDAAVPAPGPPAPAETFVDAFLADWRVHGAQTITQLRTEKPADYVRIAASLFAKEVAHEVDPLDALTDAALAERIDEIAASLGLEIRPTPSAASAGDADEDASIQR
jgi:hypothetical protein